MYPSYIAKNINELLDAAPEDVQEFLESEEIGKTAITLGKIYRVSIDSYVALANIISFILIGALKPEDVMRALVDMVGVSQGDALKIAEDLDKSILEKARIKILGKSPKDLVELTFQEGRTPDELRKEILDTTKRESAFVKEQTSSPIIPVTQTVPPVIESTDVEGVPSLPSEPTTAPTTASSVSVPVTAPSANPSSVATKTSSPKKFEVSPSSRSQLMEQLQVLDAIPNDDEVTERLSKIQEQISSMEKKDDSALETKVPLQQFMFGEKGGETVTPEFKSATYSKAPTRYNVDPYRETADES